MPEYLVSLHHTSHKTPSHTSTDYTSRWKGLDEELSVLSQAVLLARRPSSP